MGFFQLECFGKKLSTRVLVGELQGIVGELRVGFLCISLHGLVATTLKKIDSVFFLKGSQIELKRTLHAD